MTFLHAFDDISVIAGQGTIGLELLEQCPQLEAVVVPVGGGGLIAGIACAVKELRPEVKIIGVETARLPSMLLALAQHGPVTIPAASTIADGIAVRRAGENHVSPRCEIRRRNRDRGGRGDCQRDPDLTRTRENSGGGRRRGWSRSAAATEDLAQRAAYRRDRRRRQY